MRKINGRTAWRWAFDTTANVSILAALTAPIIIAGAALGTETSYWYYKQRKLQAGADAAAYAGGIERRGGAAVATVRTVAEGMALRSGYDGGGVITVNTPPTSGPNAGRTDAVEVIINQNAQRFFSDFFDDSPVPMRARAVARFRTAANACVLALSPTASRAAQFSGNTNLNLIGCSVMSNSIAADAVNVQGSARMSTPCIYAVGGASLTTGATMTDAECAANGAKTGVSKVADPFEDVVMPARPNGCRNGNGSRLSAGRYCNGLSLSGNVTLDPGVYYIDGGTLRINSNASISGTGVTFVLANGARVSMNGNATVNLQAPTSGTYSGILFMGDRDSSGGQRNTFNGTAASRMTGAIYFPTQAVGYLGNFSGQNGCTQIVANTVEWTGSTTMRVDCSAFGMRSIAANQVVQLVE
jgi:hypothetical protein